MCILRRLCLALLLPLVASLQPACFEDGCPDAVDEGSLLQTRSLGGPPCGTAVDCNVNTAQCELPDVQKTPSLDGTKTALNAGKEGAKLAVKAVFTIGKEVAKLHPVGVFLGSIFEGLISAFWPATKAEKGPCEDVVRFDHGQCLWEQVGSFVSDHVDNKLSQLMYRDYAALFSGCVQRLKGLVAWAKWDAGGLWELQENHIAEQLFEIDQEMVLKIPKFTAPGKPHAAAAFYAQFASLHISVRAAAYSTNRYRVEPYLNNTMDLLETYLDQLPAMVSEAKFERLGDIKITTDNDDDGHRERWRLYTVSDKFPSCNWASDRMEVERWSTVNHFFDYFGGGHEEHRVCKDLNASYYECLQSRKSYVSDEQDKFWKEAVLDVLPELEKYKDALRSLPQLNSTELQDFLGRAQGEKEHLGGLGVDDLIR